MRFRVTGHRIDQAKLTQSPDFVQHMRDFAKGEASPLAFFFDDVRDHVTHMIFDKLSRGQWFRSKAKRYNYYRTWVKHRYGSDRQRKAVGDALLASGQRAEGEPYADRHMQMGGWSPDREAAYNFFRMQFLARTLNRKMEQGQQPGKERYYGIHVEEHVSKYKNQDTGDTQKYKRYWLRSGIGNPATDLRALVLETEKILATYQGKRKDNPHEAARYMAEEAKGLLDPTSEYVKILSSSQSGQRILRQVNQLALRHTRNREVVANSPNSIYGQEMFKDKDYQRLQAFYRNAAASFSDMSDSRKGGKGMPTLVGANFVHGYQTGGLARAWQNADTDSDGTRFSALGTRFKTVATWFPDPGLDMVKTGAGTRSLTQLMRRNIMRNGGDPNLLTRNEARKAVSYAIESIREGHIFREASAFKGRYRFRGRV